jgi:hypothetical protein
MLEQPEQSSDVDVIVCWPRNCDYPLWRDFIHIHRAYFKDVFVVFTETHQGHDYREFVKEAMNERYEDNITFLQNPVIGTDQDWRDIGVNLALEQSTGNWVWFTEQDLFVTDRAFWPMMAKYMFNFDAVTYKEGSRVHPANMWVKKEWINKSNKNFGIEKDTSDHFFKFFNNIRLQGAKIKNIPYPNANFYHMSGLSQSMTQIERGDEVNYHPEDFLGYLEMCFLQEGLDEHYKEVIGMGIIALQKQLADERTD